MIKLENGVDKKIEYDIGWYNRIKINKEMEEKVMSRLKQAVKMQRIEQLLWRHKKKQINRMVISFKE